MADDPEQRAERRGSPRARDADSVLTPDVDARAAARPVEPGAPTPDLARTGRVLARARSRSFGITVLAALAVLYTLYFARAFLLPVVFALLLDFFFSPIVRALARLHIRPPLGAGIVVLGLIGIVSFGVYELSGPVQGWAARAPQTIATAQEKIEGLLAPLVRVRETAAQVERATSGGDEAESREVIVQGPSLMSRLFGTTQHLAAAILQVLILLYFLLAAGDMFLQKLVKVLPDVEDKETAVQIARKTESSISTYLLTATAVNVGEGVVVAGSLHLLGMPNPLLWGTLVVLLEFIPYLGAAILTVVLTLAALTVFDTVGQALLIPAAYLFINLIQGNFVSPLLLADRLTLNPVAIFVGFAFWWWIWGIPGAFIAVPLLATMKIVCDHIEPLTPIGEFLGQRDARERRTIIREGEG